MAPTFCACPVRIVAQKDGWFIPAPPFDGWVFTDAPLRHSSPAGAVRNVENHNGEPFVWTCCPFCGLDLPDQHYDFVWRDDATGEGPE